MTPNIARADMNDAYREIIAAGADERLNLFLTAATRMGTPVQNVQKDFWVCWVLDALFHGTGDVGLTSSAGHLPPKLRSRDRSGPTPPRSPRQSSLPGARG